MQELISKQSWQFDPQGRKNFDKLAHRIIYYLERLTGRRFFEYRNYKKV